MLKRPSSSSSSNDMTGNWIARTPTHNREQQYGHCLIHHHRFRTCVYVCVCLWNNWQQRTIEVQRNTIWFWCETLRMMMWNTNNVGVECEMSNNNNIQKLILLLNITWVNAHKRYKLYVYIGRMCRYSKESNHPVNSYPVAENILPFIVCTTRVFWTIPYVIGR